MARDRLFRRDYWGRVRNFRVIEFSADAAFGLFVLPLLGGVQWKKAKS
jgi:hypothetical protein